MGVWSVPRSQQGQQPHHRAARTGRPCSPARWLQTLAVACSCHGLVSEEGSSYLPGPEAFEFGGSWGGVKDRVVGGSRAGEVSWDENLCLPVPLPRCSSGSVLCLTGHTAEPAALKARASASCCPEPEGRGSGHPGVPVEGPQALGRAGQASRRSAPHRYCQLCPYPGGHHPVHAHAAVCPQSFLRPPVTRL